MYPHIVLKYDKREAYRNKKDTLGLCIDCGKHEQYRQRVCIECRDKKLKRKRQYNKKRREVYIAEGRCVKCSAYLDKDTDTGYKCCLNCRQNVRRKHAIY